MSAVEQVHWLKKIYDKLVSGITAKVSGEAVRISGETVAITGTVTTSISGQTVIAKISGEAVVTELLTQLRQGKIQVHSRSGGVALGSGEIASVDLRNLPGNGTMWFGSSPYSGYGYLLLAGESRPVKIDNLNKVYVFAQISGEYVVYHAEAR